MRVQILDVAWGDAGILKSQLHDPAYAPAILRRSIRMVGVAVSRVAHQFSENRGAALYSVVVLFQNEHAGALPNDEPVATGIPGPRGGYRIIIPRGKSTHGSEAGHGERGDCSFTPAANHHVCVAALNHPEGFTHRVCTRGAGRGAGQIG